MNLDEQYKIAKWYEYLKATTNEKFLPLFTDTHKFLVLVGGGGSGKSIFAGRKVIERIIGEPGHRILVVRKVARTLRESCFRQLQGQIATMDDDGMIDYKDWKINQSDMSMTYLPNGSQIIFAGLDDVQKLKSIYNITSIWIEEADAIDERDLNQLTIRLRGVTTHYKQIIISFNPISINHWLKKRFFDRTDPDVLTVHSTYLDNPFLPEDDRKVLEGYKETDPYYYDVYALGKWGVLGNTIFSKQDIQARIDSLGIPKKVGSFLFTTYYDKRHHKVLIDDKSIVWQDTPAGYVKIYKDVEPDYPYVIGGDTSGDGSDNFTGQVLNNITGEQVAVLKHRLDEDHYAQQMYCLGKYYNTALLAVEVNFSTFPQKKLQEYNYPKLYVREKEDTIANTVIKSYGFKTTSVTRPIILAELMKYARDHVELINDVDTLNEMLTFVRNEKSGRPEAEAGSHDDLVIALAIALYVRPQQSYELPEKPVPKCYNFSFEKPKPKTFEHGKKIKFV